VLETESRAAEQSRRASGQALDFETLDSAPVTYQEVLRDPDNVALNFRFARTQVSQGRFRGASATLERILRLNPKLAAVRLLYAIVLFRLDNLGEAELEFRAVAALDISPGTAAEIDKFLDRIQTARQTTNYSVSLSLGVHLDTNKTSSPRSNQLLVSDALTTVGRAEAALETLRVVQGGRRSFQIKTAGASGEYAMGASTGITKVKIGSFVIPTDSRGRMRIHFTDAVPERFIPAWKVFEADFPRQAVEGMILLIGTSAAGLKDQRPTPLNPAAAGVEVHAQALEQMILGKFLERPDWAEGAEILYLAGLGLLLITLLPWHGALWCAVLGGGATLGAFGFSWYAYDTLGMLFDPVYPSIFALMVYIILSLVNFLRNEAEKNQVRGAFSRYMSPALVEQLAENPDQLQLGGVMRDMTILFADVRGFTAISEIYKSDPQGLTSLINRFLTPTTNVILARQGTIDNYMGDCIMAFWNAPLDDDDHARHACSSAMQMMIVVDELNVVLEAEAKAEDRRFIPIIIGIGLNSGECCVGNMGSEQRFNYSVLGDDVNLAARLEGQSKTHGVDIVIGENTYSRALDFAYIELDLIKVKGKNEAVRIHALLGKPEIGETADFIALAERHAAMLTAYRAQNWDEARSLGTECRPLGEKFGGLDRLYDLYDGRIDEFVADPPGADWDGVFVATTK